MHAQRAKRQGDPNKVERLRGAPLEDRLWFRTTVTPGKLETDCWAFGGAILHRKRSGSGDSYRGIRVGENMLGAHVAAYAELVGPIPDGHEVHHLCGLKSCWHPEHLQALTSREHFEVHHERPTHCPQNHPYSGDNLYERVNRRGWTVRYCRTCAREARRRHRAKRT